MVTAVVWVQSLALRTSICSGLSTPQIQCHNMLSQGPKGTGKICYLPLVLHFQVAISKILEWGRLRNKDPVCSREGRPGLSIMVISLPSEEGGSEQKGGNIYQPLGASCRDRTTHVPRIIAGGGGGRNRRAGPCAHPAGCEKFSWVLFIVSIIPGNEDSAIRTQLAVVLGMCEAE